MQSPTNYLFLIFVCTLSLASDRQNGTAKVTAKQTPSRNATVSSDPIKPFIVGGRKASPGEFPWIVNLRIDVGNNKYTFCGGTLIELV